MKCCLGIETIIRRLVVFIWSWRRVRSGKRMGGRGGMNWMCSMWLWMMIKLKNLNSRELVTSSKTSNTLSTQVGNNQLNFSTPSTCKTSTPPTPPSPRSPRSSTTSGTKVKCPSTTQTFTCANAENCILSGKSECGLRSILGRRLKLMRRCSGCWWRKSGGVGLKNWYSRNWYTSMEGSF